MATLLRKVRLQLGHSASNERDPPETLPTSRSTKHSLLTGSGHRHKRCDLSTAVESQHSVQLRERGYQHKNPISLAEFRRRLAKRTSTFSLRNKQKPADSKDIYPPLPKTYHPFSVEDKTEPDFNLDNTAKSLDSGQPTEDNVVDNKHHLSLAENESITAKLPLTTTVSSEREICISTVKLETQEDQSQVSTVAHLKIPGPQPATTWSKMASDSATPPIPYESMKDIATEACDAALSSVSSYTHAATETWNTNIINKILSELVQKTSTSSSQPSYKYVVNSTIIQHAAGTFGDEGKVSGRRGMHSASGAYWNNEKDGMWSFKYEAAEAKGLDVVVGIHWIWVG